MKNIPNDKLEDYYTDTLLKLNTKQYPGLTKDKFMKISTKSGSDKSLCAQDMVR